MTKNAKAFQQKISDSKLKDLIKKKKMDGQQLLKKTGMRSYSLQQRLFKICAETQDASYAVVIPDDVEYKTKCTTRGLHVSSKICKAESIKEGAKFDIAVDKGVITLSPIK